MIIILGDGFGGKIKVQVISDLGAIIESGHFVDCEMNAGPVSDRVTGKHNFDNGIHHLLFREGLPPSFPDVPQIEHHLLDESGRVIRLVDHIRHEGLEPLFLEDGG